MVTSFYCVVRVTLFELHIGVASNHTPFYKRGLSLAISEFDNIVRMIGHLCSHGELLHVCNRGCISEL